MTSSRRAPVETGLDRLVTDESLSRRLGSCRLGLLTNQAAVTRDLTHTVFALDGAGLRPERLFAPEHGIWGHAQDMQAVDSGRDPVTGIDVVSLYGHDAETLVPDASAFEGLDAVLIDVPDIGARYYTFAATAAWLAEGALAAGLDVWVLDRPNPIGGVEDEGNLVEPGYESFVSALSVPNRHALTLAELLRWYGRFGRSGNDPALFDSLRVIECRGWRRGLWHDETGQPWVFPSPNMPSLDTAAIYPGLCLLEATTASEGRGTTRPFELIGAPWVDAAALAAALEAMDLPGVRFRPTIFEPKYQKWAGRSCRGVQIHLVDRPRIRSYELGLSIVWALHDLFPADFAWRPDPYEFIEDIPAIDLLCGTSRVREAIEGGGDRLETIAQALRGAEDWPEQAQAIRIYPLDDVDKPGAP